MRFVERARAGLFGEPTSAWLGPALGALVGVAVNLYVFGLGYALGRSSYWTYPTGDPSMQYAGYMYFIQDSWHWPLLKTASVAAPRGLNIIHTDSIPLIAIAGKLWFGISGRAVNLYGPWMMACYALQGWFAARLASAMGEKRIFAAIGAALLAVTAAPFLLRFYHQGLCAQFVVLWALTLYFELGATADLSRSFRSFSTLSVLALLTHPYLAAMSMPIFMATLLRQGRARPLAALSAFLGVCLTLVSVGLAFGHISGQVLSGRSGGFGEASLNVLGPLLPVRGHSHLGALIPARFTHVGIQWDGAFFLGLGVLTLLAFNAVASSHDLHGIFRRHRAFALVLVLLALYAVSNQAYAGSRLVYRFELPETLRWGLEQFRATGRFFWPVGYAIIVGTFVLTLRFRRRFVGHLLAIGCVVLQVVDAHAPISIVQENTDHAWKTYADWSEWRSAIRAHRRIRMYPSYDCLNGLAQTLIGFEERELQFIAAQENRPVNGLRTGRPTTDCAAELNESATPADDDTLTLRARAVYPTNDHPDCFNAGVWSICSSTVGRDPSLLRSARATAPPELRVPAVIDFTSGSIEAISYLEPEWSLYDWHRVWVGSREATLHARVPDVAASVAAYELEVNADAQVDGDAPVTLRVRAGDEDILAHTFTRQENPRSLALSARIPRRFVENGELLLRFVAEGPRRLDNRLVGIDRISIR